MDKYKIDINHLLKLTTKAVIKSHKTERGELLTEIVNEINKERVNTKFKPLSIKLLAIKLGHIPTSHLYFLKSEALDYRNRGKSYGQYVFGAIKTKYETRNI